MYILFDIGATNMRFALSKDLNSFDEPVVIPNSRRYEDDMVAIKETIDKMSHGKHIKGMAGGIAGTFDMETGILLGAPNMPSWVGKPLLSDLQRMTGLRPIIINDADLAGLGEAIYGAGHGYHAVAYMTVSTGIGGGLIIDGKPLPVRFSPEPGWQILNYETKETLHELAAGKDLEAKHGMKPKELPAEVYQEVSHHLAVGIYNMILFWSPDIVVMGGSQMRDISIEDLNGYVKALKADNIQIPEIVPAKLAGQNGLFGAMALLK
jgi:glucokinase